MVPSSASQLLSIAAKEQDQIGWHNFLVGRISSAWGMVQQQYFDAHTTNPNAHHGRCWMKRFIPRIYELVHEVWLYRNSVVHNAVEEKLNQQELRKLNIEIDGLYAQGASKVCHTHRFLFDEGMEATKQRSVRQKKYWVKTLTASLAYKTHAEENMYVGMRNIMRQWTLQPD